MKDVAAYRARTFHLVEDLRLKTLEEAVRFVDARGFVFFWPIRGVEFPSLWSAVAGNRPVANAHDDPGHVTWGWKDEMLVRPGWYYAKVLRGKSTMIAPRLLPAFYALSDNFGDPEHDYQSLYDDGLLQREAKLLYETLLREGPLDTVRLRRAAQLTSKSSNSPYDRAMTYLQRNFMIVPTGVAEAGAWRYSFVYDAVHRRYPELPEQARAIGRGTARTTLLHGALRSLGSTTVGNLKKLFQWRPRELDQAVAQLVGDGRAQSQEAARKNGRLVILAETTD